MGNGKSRPKELIIDLLSMNGYACVVIFGGCFLNLTNEVQKGTSILGRTIFGPFFVVHKLRHSHFARTGVLKETKKIQEPDSIEVKF